MKIRHCLLTLLGLLIPAVLNAVVTDEIHFTHIGLEEGLSHSTVFAINQDNEGYLWFATYDGVNKYDGYNFTVYRHQHSDPNSIASDISSCIAIDDLDRIWIGTREGLSLYNHLNDRFSNYYYRKNGQNVAINKIVPMEKNLLMLGTNEGILLFDVKNEKFLSDTLSASLHGLHPSSLTRQDDSILIGTADGVYDYSLSDGSLNRLLSLPSESKVQDILCQPFNRIWIATEGNGLYLFNPKTKELKNYRFDDEKSSLNSNFVRTLSLDSENRLWVGTYGGVNIYREGTDSFMSISSSELKEGSLSQNSVRSIFRDSQDGMWLGTYWGGLNYYHPLCNRFQHIKHIPLYNSLSNNVVSCIVADREQNLWIGTSDGGLNYYDNALGKYRNYLIQSDNPEGPFKDIKTIYVDEAGDRVYVGAHSGGMMVLNRKTGGVEYYNRHNRKSPTSNIYSIISDGQNGLWVSSLEYLLHFDKRKGAFSIVDPEMDVQELKRCNRLLFRDSRGRIWAGGEKGLTVFNQDGESLIPNNDSELPPELEQTFINCFYETTSGNVLVGTHNGLFALREKEHTVVQYTSTDGLPSNIIYGILEDAYGRLWVSTNQGLSCFNLENGIFRNFTIMDGLQGNQFNAGSYCRKDNGYMLFGGINGITSFLPETLIDNPYTPKPIINKLLVHNREVLPDDETGILEECISRVDGITLSPSQNSFAISFVVSNYIAGKHNTFAYRLMGYDDTWYEQNDISPVSYSNLPAGEYTFCIKAANNDGKWNEEPTELNIRVLPVWYRTWWALTLFALLFALIVFSVLRFMRMRRDMQTEIRIERLDKEKQEEISQMKIRFYVNISHELRTPLTLIIAPLQELLSRVKGQWEQKQLLYIQQNTNRLLHLINQLMDFRRAELGIFELRVVYSNAYKRMSEVFMNYEGLARRKKMEYDFLTELQDRNVLFDENYIDLILNNLLSNAFKYTKPGGSIIVRLYLEDNNLVIQVSDTGIGIPADKQKHIFERFYRADSGSNGSGIGLSLVQRLVELHHGKITLKSEVGEGSVFTVYLPQDKSAYTQEELLGLNGEPVEQNVYSTNANDNYIGDGDSLEMAAEDGSREDSGQFSKRGTILIVEDNTELRQYIRSGLSELFDILEAEDGQKAMDVLKTNDVDLIITDVMMPVMDGIKLCRNVKQNLRTCHIPVYMLSAKADIKCQMEGLVGGADDYISKPFSMEVLRTKILNMLRTRNRMYERYSKGMEIEPEKITNNTIDEEFLRKAIAVVEKNMDNTEFSTEQFAQEMNMSRSNLHLKLKGITGQSAIDFIHKIRFNRACQLLKEGKYTVSEISYMVGYSTPSYFASRFKKYVGCLPTEYGKSV